MKVAGAPISWGVCEVPGWGVQLDADRVLAEMRDAGLTATEFGPDGFLRPERLTTHGLRAIGGFIPVVLHDPAHDPLPGVDAALDMFTAAGAGTLVLAAVTGRDGYDTRPDLDGTGWATLLRNLDRLAGLAHRRGITATLHPHVGTMVERTAEVWRVLDGSAMPLCLDTGHLLIGGADPAALAREVPHRIAHVHLKDVDAAAAARVRAGEIGYADAVAAGMYRPLGQGDVDVAGIVASLTDAGYEGWYVLEQDTVLTATPPPGEGPISDVRTSLAHLHAVTP